MGRFRGGGTARAAFGADHGAGRLSPLRGEWWHFSDTEPYPYEDLERLRFPLDRQTVFEPDGDGPLSLRAAPDRDAEVLAQVPAGTAFQVLGWAGDYARIELQGQQGYVAADDIRVKP